MELYLGLYTSKGEIMKRNLSALDVYGWILIGAYGLVIGIIFITLIFHPILKVSHIRTETITVTDKMVKNDTYLIYSEDSTYEITDSVLRLRFNSSDLYGRIEVGKTYEITVGGKRVPIFSWYPNIYKAVEVGGS